MKGFKPLISGFGSNRTTKSATTTAHLTEFIVLEKSKSD